MACLPTPGPGTKPHLPVCRAHGLVHPERILEVTVIHPVSEVLALAVMPPGLPEEEGWGRRETKSAATFSSCSDKDGEEVWALKQKLGEERGYHGKEKKVNCIN